MARQQLALELAKMTIERFIGRPVPVRPYAQTTPGWEPLDLADRLAGRSQIIAGWRMERRKC